MTVWLEHRQRPLTLNEINASRDHWKRSKEVATWREAFGWLAKAQKPMKPPVEIVVHHLRKTKRVVDLGAVMMAAKGAQDGLVDGGMLPDDTPDIVSRLTFVPAEHIGYDGLALEISEVRS